MSAKYIVTFQNGLLLLYIVRENTHLQMAWNMMQKTGNIVMDMTDVSTLRYAMDLNLQVLKIIC